MPEHASEDHPQKILEEAMQEGRLRSESRRYYSRRLSRALLREVSEVTELVRSGDMPERCVQVNTEEESG